MPHPPKATRSWYRYEEGRDSPSEARNVLLIVVSLIATVTFQAGVYPPGGVWQDDQNGHRAGRAIYASQQIAYYVFLVSNTVALSSSVLVIVSLTYKFPFHKEIWVATMSMAVTYASAVVAVTPHQNVRYRHLLAAAALPFLLRFFIHLFNKATIKIQAYYSSTPSSPLTSLLKHNRGDLDTIEPDTSVC